MAIFYNQASLTYDGRVSNSNITEGEVLDSAGITKTALSTSYTEGGSIVYAVSIANNSANSITDGTLTDTLGEYEVNGTAVYPLSYVDGSVKLYIDGSLATPPVVNAGPPMTVSGISIPSGATALLIYEAKVTEFAPLASGSTITNAAVFNSALCGTAISDSSTVPVQNFVNLTIAKAVFPLTVTNCDEISYTFIIQNTGNTPVVATDDVIVRDTFNPILNPISATYNGEEWTEGVNYTYSDTTGEFATLPGQITVPAATYVQNAETGVFTTTPGVAVITINGNV